MHTHCCLWWYVWVIHTVIFFIKDHPFLQVFSIVVFSCIVNEGYINIGSERLLCVFNNNADACNYGLTLGVGCFLGSLCFLVLDFYFPSMSNIKDRKRAVLLDLIFSGNLARRGIEVRKLHYVLQIWTMNGGWKDSNVLSLLQVWPAFCGLLASVFWRISGRRPLQISCHWIRVRTPPEPPSLSASSPSLHGFVPDFIDSCLGLLGHHTRVVIFTSLFGRCVPFCSFFCSFVFEGTDFKWHTKVRSDSYLIHYPSITFCFPRWQVTGKDAQVSLPPAITILRCFKTTWEISSLHCVRVCSKVSWVDMFFPREASWQHSCQISESSIE